METPGTALIGSFERHLRAANRAPRTIGNYLETLFQAETYLSSHGSGLERATRQDLEAFLAHLLSTGRSGSTAATRYKWLRAFYKWLEDEEEIPKQRCSNKAAPSPARSELTSTIGPASVGLSSGIAPPRGGP
jgi:site-specific recombinase XerD